MGKAYANKKSKDKRPKGDMYHTPKSLIWVMKDVIEQEFDKSRPVLEPCSGQGSISDELTKYGFAVITNDLHYGGVDYLTEDFSQKQVKQVITNPPFSLWDAFVNKAKSHSDKIMVIGRLNYLGTHSRNTGGIWKNLKAVYCFDRYVDYQTPYRQDGLFHVGAMATAWFLFDMQFTKNPTVYIVDVQQHAKLGNLK